MAVEHLVGLAERLEDHLGDPHDDAGGRMSFRKVLRHDEQEDYPHELASLLQAWGIHEYCLPERWGGKAGDVEVGFNLVRLVARRDPTTATALMITNVAFMPTWTAGTDPQGTATVEAIKRGTRMSWGLSERHHGSDVLANDMRAEPVPGGYRLTGEKYLIGNATIADVVSVQARTAERRGPGAWSILNLDKRQCPAGTVTPLPNERLHGLRALDMSGIRLDGVFVPEQNLVGAEGQGLELALKGAQVARTVIAAIALGAVDTALRVTLDFAEGREIFGRKVADIPYSRRQLAECFADLLLADAVSAGAVRGLQCNPAQASVYSSVVKYFIPTLLERTAGQLSVVLGARFYLRDHPHFGIFQKMLRDLSAVSFVDGNTVVNLKNIAAQLEGLLTVARDAEDPVRAEAAERAEAMYGLDAELPEWRPERQLLISRGRDDALLALPAALARLRDRARGHRDADQREWYLRAADLGDRLAKELYRLDAEAARIAREAGRGHTGTAEQFRLAEQYCVLHAGAAALHLAAWSGDALGGAPDGAVLLLQMERVWRLLYPAETVTDAAVVDRAMEVLRGLHEEGRLFSHWPIRVRSSHDRVMA
ncbi:acyl-CoA dehydrogenase [Glycomyces xiaoerkulensis]|uniref:acyl-CoA dehydrogenase n=1 Tax=Glycomyces xiaoerkulensis TaxID=2038139 RepID=UPI000C269F80|nr:acyl-CoA dehydrogenase [Glycomyces xiaoerkulensis]